MAEKYFESIIKKSLLYLLLFGFVLVFVGPFLWMVSSSLKTDARIFIYPPQWIPRDPQWGNYVEMFQAMPFARYFYNSSEISILATIGTLLSCSLAAYGFARLRFPGRDIIFFILISTMMIPYEVTMIPVFLIMKTIGWLNSPLPLIVPHYLAAPFGTFLLRQYFLTIPQEIEDAAFIDGASRFRIYWSFFLPLAKPALATLAVLTFMSSWGELLGPVIYLSNRENMTLTVGLVSFIQGGAGDMGLTRWNLLMAGSIISLLPILILFAVAQKYFVQGITMTGIKG